MNWSEILAESFPEPRGDEPASLRQDIADELADHLQSALDRRLVTTPDLERARAQVLDRFGDPQQIARQLWWDALKEKIMSQRIMLALTAVLAIVTLSALGLIWRVVERSQAATLEMVERTRAANEALLERLSKLSAATANAEPAAPPRSADWNPVTAHLVLATDGRPPAKGFTVTLMRMKSNLQPPMGGGMGGGPPNSELVAAERTGKDGIADLGLVSPGKYTLTVQSPLGRWLGKHLVVHPGSVNTVEIVCPPGPDERGDVALRCELPDDLRGRGLDIVFRFRRGTTRFDDSEWGIVLWNGQTAVGGDICLLFVPDSREVAFRYFNLVFRPSTVGPPGLQRASLPPQAEPAARANLAAGDYYLEAVAIGARKAQPDQNAPAGSTSDGLHFVAGMRLVDSGLDRKPTAWWFGGEFNWQIDASQLSQLPKLELKPNQLNEWALTVPEDLWQAAREVLAQPLAPASEDVKPGTE